MSDTNNPALDPDTEQAREDARAEWEQTEDKLNAADDLGEENEENEKL